jgi:hypothetical protein
MSVQCTFFSPTLAVECRIVETGLRKTAVVMVLDRHERGGDVCKRRMDVSMVSANRCRCVRNYPETLGHLRENVIESAR